MVQSQLAIRNGAGSAHTEEMDQNSVIAAARILREARAVVALTGAGISTPSGIPDFRGDGGLWQRDDPAEVASLGGFFADPGRFYRWFAPLLARITAAQPNPAHVALAELERRGRLRAVVTQNIDGLHQRAGSREVYELHGSLRHASCATCGQCVPAGYVCERVHAGATPRCSCGGPIKPDIVLFDEALPRGVFWLAQRALEQCDALIIAGTSLEVCPAGDLPHLALRRGARLVIVNRGATHLDDRADVIIRDDVAAVLPAMVAEVDRFSEAA